MGVETGIEEAGRAAHLSPVLDRAVSAGLVAYALVHLVIAWLGFQLAVGERDDRVDSGGALHELAQQPLGGFVLVAVAAGMACLVVWRLLELVYAHQDEDAWDRWRHRAIAVGTVVAYAALGISAIAVLRGDSGRDRTEESWTARLLGTTAGPWLVAAVGVAFLGYTAAMSWRGLTGRHARHLSGEARHGEASRAYLLVGTIGYLAKGIAFGIVGLLFLWAAWTHDPSESGGLDEALGRLLQQPAGPFLLAAMSIGLGCFGAFQLVRARYLRRPRA